MIVVAWIGLALWVLLVWLLVRQEIEQESEPPMLREFHARQEREREQARQHARES